MSLQALFSGPLCATESSDIQIMVSFRHTVRQHRVYRTRRHDHLTIKQSYRVMYNEAGTYTSVRTNTVHQYLQRPVNAGPADGKVAEVPPSPRFLQSVFIFGLDGWVVKPIQGHSYSIGRNSETMGKSRQELIQSVEMVALRCDFLTPRQCEVCS